MTDRKSMEQEVHKMKNLVDNTTKKICITAMDIALYVALSSCRVFMESEQFPDGIQPEEKGRIKQELVDAWNRRTP